MTTQRTVICQSKLSRLKLHRDADLDNPMINIHAPIHSSSNMNYQKVQEVMENSSNSDSDPGESLFQRYLNSEKQKQETLQRCDSNMNEMDVSPQKTPIASSFNIDDPTPKRNPQEIALPAKVPEPQAREDQAREPGELTPEKDLKVPIDSFKLSQTQGQELLKFGNQEQEMDMQIDDGSKENEIMINDHSGSKLDSLYNQDQVSRLSELSFLELATFFRVPSS